MNDDSPIIIVNLKAYEQGYGANGYDLCKIMEEIALEHKVNLAAAVSPIDLVDFSDNLDIPIFAQHVDGVNFGSYTGSILPEAVRYSGAAGTLVNHAECQMSWEEIEKTIRTFKLGNKQQEKNLIDALKISCRKFSKEKTGKKPFTNINLVKI